MVVRVSDKGISACHSVIKESDRQRLHYPVLSIASRSISRASRAGISWSLRARPSTASAKRIAVSCIRSCVSPEPPTRTISFDRVIRLCPSSPSNPTPRIAVIVGQVFFLRGFRCIIIHPCDWSLFLCPTARRDLVTILGALPGLWILPSAVHLAHPDSPSFLRSGRVGCNIRLRGRLLRKFLPAILPSQATRTHACPRSSC